MNLSKFIRNYLAGASVKEPIEVTITSIEIETIGQGEAAEDQPVAYFKELELGLPLNKVNLKFLEAKTGTAESDKWIGQKVVLFFDPHVLFQGKKVGGLRLRDAA